MHNNGSAWVDTDISGESARVQAICNATWTDATVAAYKSAVGTVITHINIRKLRNKIWH